MYHNQDNMIELHDDVVGVEKSHLDIKDGHPVRLHVTYILRPTRKYALEKDADVRLHSTNGVNHRYIPVNAPDPSLDMYAESASAQPVENGQNRSVLYDGEGDPYMTHVETAEFASGAPLEQGEQRQYGPDLAYYHADFNEHENDATRRMRRQQELVDKTTAKKRSKGEGSGAPANSMTEREAKRDEKEHRSEGKKQEEVKDHEEGKQQHGHELRNANKEDKKER